METPKRKQLSRMIALLLALLMLCGCEKSTTEPTESTTEPTTAPTVQPTEPSAPTEPTEPEKPTEPEGPEIPEDPELPEDPEIPEDPELPEDPLLEMAALTHISCVEFDVFPELLSLGNGLVVASRNTYRSGQGRINETQIIDIYNDQIVASAVRSCSMELVTQSFPDGSIVMAEPDSGNFVVFDQTLTEIHSFSAPNLDGVFSHDRSSYYYVQEGGLYCVTLSTGVSAEVTLEQELHIVNMVDIHPSENRLVAQIYLSAQGEACGMGVIEPETGKLLLFRQELSHVWLTGENFYGVATNPTQMGFDVFYGGLVDGEVKRIPLSQLNENSVHYAVLPGSEYLLWWTVPDSGTRATKVYDLSNGAVVAELINYGFATATHSAIYLRQEQLIVGYYSVKGEVTASNPRPKETFHMVVINPLKLFYTDGATPESASWQNRVDVSALEAINPT